MVPLFYALATDTDHLGRFDKHSLTDQVRMELLFGCLVDIKRLQDKEGDFNDACEWPGVQCNEEFAVTSMDFDNTDYLRRCMADLLGWDANNSRELGLSPGGSMDLQWIPETVTDFRVSGLSLEGQVNTQWLPRELRQFTITNNKFHGEFVTSELPEHLETVRLSSNMLSGSLSLHTLPRFLVSFDASSNKFSGTLNLRKLPTFLKILDVNSNCFTGMIEICFVPPKIRTLNFSMNSFSNEKAIISSIPEAVENITIDEGLRGKVLDMDGNVWESGCISFYNDDID